MDEDADDPTPSAAPVSDRRIPTTPRWRQWMADAMEVKGLSQTDLAELVPCTQASISLLLAGKQTRSVHVPAICEVLGIPPPYVEVLDEHDEPWVLVGRALREGGNTVLFASNLAALRAQVCALQSSARPEDDPDRDT